MTKQSDSLTGAKFIAETLKGYGVTHVFYVEAMLRMAAAEMERLGITRVITHSEMAAAYMADGYARAGGKPGVCMAQSVGAANLAAGLQDAYLGSSPVIALTGKKPPIKQMRNAYQEVDHRPLFDPVTVFNTSVDEPQQLPGLLRQAFREALSSKPRPVHLDLRGRMGRPIETAVFDPADLLVEPAYVQGPVHRPAAPAEAVKQATVQISTAERPVIPTRLSRPFNGLVRASEVDHFTDGALSASVVLEKVQDWRSLNDLQGTIVASEIAGHLRKIGFDVVRPITRSDLLRREMGGENRVNVELGMRLGDVITLATIEEEPLDRERKQLLDVAKQASFFTQDGAWRHLG